MRPFYRVEAQDDEFGPEWTWCADFGREEWADAFIANQRLLTGGVIEFTKDEVYGTR